MSAVTVWEIEIKLRLGRLDMGEEDLIELLVSSRHARHAAQLPPHHEDPFDRMLAAQCLLEGLTCVSKDAALAVYGMPMLW